MGRHGTIAGRKAAQDSKRAALFTKKIKFQFIHIPCYGKSRYSLYIESGFNSSIPCFTKNRKLKIFSSFRVYLVSFPLKYEIIQWYTLRRHIL